MVPEVIRYDEAFEVNALQLDKLRRSFSQRFVWRLTPDSKILVKIWDMSQANYIKSVLKKLE